MLRAFLLILSAAIVWTPGASAGNIPPTIDPTFRIPADHSDPAPTTPSDGARWIWADKTQDRQTACFRRVFQVPTTPSNAILYITGDDSFVVYLNGTRLGSSEGTSWRDVHRFEISRQLHPGANVLAIEGLNDKEEAGVVARLDIDDKPMVVTDSRWRVWNGKRSDTAWTALSFPDQDWKASTEIADAAAGPWLTSTWTIDGWPGYLPQAPDYLHHLSLRPARIVQLHDGGGKIRGVETLTREGAPDLDVALPPAGSQDPPFLVLDFGKEISGRILLSAENAGSVSVTTGESLEEAMKSGYFLVRNQLAIPQGGTTASRFSGFRYARLVFERGPYRGDHLHLRGLSADHVYYPVTYQGSFSSSDPLLDRIWYTGAYTAHLTMQDEIWDGIKRDRMAWMGDLVISGNVIESVFADRFLIEKTMLLLRGNAQGQNPPDGLPANDINGIPGYSCAWITGLADLYRHYGDVAFVKSQHAALLSMLSYLRSQVDGRGVFANLAQHWAFVDWSDGFHDDSALSWSTTHFYLVKAVREAAYLLGEIGDDRNAAIQSQWADTLTSAAQDHLTEPGKHLFGKTRHQNAMAIFAGVANEDQRRAAYEAYLRPDSPGWQEVATPYFNYFVLQAMSLAGHTPEALSVVRNYWGGMLNAGATTWWELYDPSWNAFPDIHLHMATDYTASLSHSWSAGPTIWLTERVLGIRPTGRGFETVEVAPELGDLRWVEGDVPTPTGLIHARVEQTAQGPRLQLRLPKGISATVRLPGLVKTIKGEGSYLVTSRG